MPDLSILDYSGEEKGDENGRITSENRFFLSYADGSYIRKLDGYHCFPDGSRKDHAGNWVLPPKALAHGIPLKKGETSLDFKIDVNPENITPDGKIFWRTSDGKTHYLWTKDGIPA